LSTRGNQRRATRIRVPRAAIIAGLSAFLVLASTGIAAAVWTSSASSLGGTVTAGTLSVTVTPADIAGLNATFSPSVLSDTAAISVTNSGNVPANYTVQVKAASNGLSNATTLTGWLVTSASQCTPTSAVGAQSGSAAMSTGLSTADSVAVGAVDIFCVRTTIPASYATTVGPASVPTVLLSYTQGSWSGSSTASATQTVADTVAPSKPGTPVASATTAAKTTLTWAASTDNVAVTNYDIYRNGTLVGTVTAPTVTFTDTTVVRGTAYSYTIKARDAAGNSSAASTAASVTTLFVDSGTKYQVVNTNSSLCIDAGTANAANKTPLVIWGCATGRSQSWQFVAVGNFFKILPAASTSFSWDLDGTAGFASNDGQKAWLASYSGANSQLWQVVADSTGGGKVRFINQAFQKCLDVQNAQTANGTPLQQYTCNNTAAQSFTLTALP
jgi:hypothetical protein